MCEEGASTYDVRIGGGRGGHGKADEVREVARILYNKSAPNVDKGERVKTPKILWMSLMEAPRQCVKSETKGGKERPLISFVGTFISDVVFFRLPSPERREGRERPQKSLLFWKNDWASKQSINVGRSFDPARDGDTLTDLWPAGSHHSPK